MKKFIVIDGLDGSGKDTQSHLIYEFYKNHESDKRVILRSNPESDNYFGRTAHNALLKDGKFNKIIATICYALDIFRSLILYYPKSDIFIFSRYLLAAVYFPTALVKPVYKIFSIILPISDTMFYLDLSPEIAMDRINARSISNNQEFQSFENLESLKKCRKKAYLITSDWIIIDASKDKNEIKEEIRNILINNENNEEYLKNREDSKINKEE